VPVPNLSTAFKVVMNYTCGLTTFENVLHVFATHSNTEQQVADDCATAWMATGSLKTIISSTAIGGYINVQKYDGVSAPVLCSSGPFTLVNMTGSGGPVPAQTCGLITLRTGLAGRSFRGRVYLGAVRSGLMDSTGAQWNSASLATLQAASTAWVNAMTLGSHVTGLGVYSAKYNTMAAVTSNVFRQYCGTQRRRAEQRM
jgi:hypothetical protein